MNPRVWEAHKVTGPFSAPVMRYLTIPEKESVTAAKLECATSDEERATIAAEHDAWIGAYAEYIDWLRREAWIKAAAQRAEYERAKAKGIATGFGSPLRTGGPPVCPDCGEEVSRPGRRCKEHGLIERARRFKETGKSYPKGNKIWNNDKI